MNIGDNVSRAIKEGKWLIISYINKNEENTFYWIAVKDIDFYARKLFVSMFNDRKSMQTMDTWISFDNLKSAQIVEFSSYDVPEKLIDKIENNLDKCEWLQYDHFSHNVLNYYMECNLLDNDPSQKEYACVPGVDLRLLRKNKQIVLNEEQAKKIIKDIYHYDIKNIGSTYYTLAINCFSIDEGNKKFVVCYYAVTFDPTKMSLVLNKNLMFNQSFMIGGRRHSLFNYINMDIDEFTATFEDKFNEYQEIIRNNLRPGEIINTRPDIMLLQREVPVDLAGTYTSIEMKYHANQLPIPLKSFFGSITKRNNIRRKEPSLIIFDKKININQMRVLYNAMKYPVTYVQGPPGTGKTQTIINVVLSAFYNEKSILVCSSNNKPVDGILEKLKFTYKGQETPFPFLRLGNFDDVKRATLKIRKLHNFSSEKVPKDELLRKITISNDNQNSELLKLLNRQETKEDIKDRLESSRKQISYFDNANSAIVAHFKEKVEQLQAKFDDLPEVTNEDLISLFIPLNENYQLSQFLFFKSLQYVEKLKRSKYSDLIAICNIQDDDERANEFNKWTQQDENMRKLAEVFPIIFSTNISSRRLGSADFMFDLVVMDEAGQCNIATALLPIAKAEALLLVGDPNQLKPVVVLDDRINDELMKKYNISPEYNYKTNSILDIMRAHDNISKYILLKYHYRCGRKIIDFSNQRYYANSLDLTYVKSPGELEVVDVKNVNIKQKNEAFEEASAIAEYIKRNSIKDAYIITPFVNQRELILSLLRGKGIYDVDCGTIHSLQGAERDTIIFSPAISLATSKRTFEWLKNNDELINVAATRAKNKLIICADTEAIEKFSDKNDDLYNLVQYAKNNGMIKVPPNEALKIEIGKSNGSIAEDEFFKTISQFCTCNKRFEAERNVKLSKIFKGSCEDGIANMEFDMVLYQKSFWGKKAVIAFEVNGGEHFGTTKRERADSKKMELCRRHGIKLIVIPNSFVKSYEYIADVILAVNNKSSIVQMSLVD